MLNISVGSSSAPQLRWSAQKASFEYAEGAQKTDLGPMTGKKLYLDFSSTRTGWMKVAAGVAPVAVWNPDLTNHTRNPAPSEVGPDGKPAFKQAIALQAMLEDGRVVEITTNAAGFLGTLVGAHAAATAAGAIGDGVVAAFECTGITMRKFGPAAVATPALKFLEAVQAPEALVSARQDFAAAHAPAPYVPAQQVAQPTATMQLQPAGATPLAMPTAVAPAPVAPAPAAAAPAVPAPAVSAPVPPAI